MDSSSRLCKPRRYLLPVAAVCLVVVLVSFSGCTGLPGMSFLKNFGFSTGPATGSSGTGASASTQAQGSGTAGQGTGGGLSCPAPYESWTVCPDNNCYDLTADPANCGACSRACSAGQTCTNGRCSGSAASTGQQGTGTLSCPAPYESWTVCPDNNCYDLTADPANCGACGNTCESGETCVSGQCSGGTSGPAQESSGGLSCPAPHEDWTACPDGYCYDLTSDEANCGACASPCGSGEICFAGVCGTEPSMETCLSPDTLCDDVCVNLQTNRANCGSCGHICTLLQICSSGSCVINPALVAGIKPHVCLSPNTPCDGDCVNLQTNRSHCGDCDTKCGTLQICSSGACVINPALVAGIHEAPKTIPCLYTICDGSCVNTDTDENNCGSCGNVCATGATCTDGSCHCPTGYYVSSGVCKKIVYANPAIVKPVVSVYVNPAIINNIVNPGL